MAKQKKANLEYLSDYKVRLDSNRTILLDDLSPGDITNQLIEDGIIDHDDADQINAEKGRKLKATALLDMIYHRGPNAYKCFRKALEENSDWLVKALDETDIKKVEKTLCANFGNKKVFFHKNHI